MYQSRCISIYLRVPLRVNLNSYLLFGCLRYFDLDSSKTLCQQELLMLSEKEAVFLGKMNKECIVRPNVGGG
jgi:hypothetical protein